MRAPGFWRGPRQDWRAACLWPLSLPYAVIASWRFARPPAARAAVPVVCVGNPTVGGAGKTPAAILVARLLEALGRRPVFLSRGYGARVSGPTLVDGSTHTAGDVGDEPLLLARVAPAVVSPDRSAGAELAASLGDVIVMDDGFQNPALARDLSLLVVDGAYGVGNGWCLPAGPLRLPLSPQLARADGLLIVGAGEAGEAVAARAGERGIPVLRGRLVPDSTMRSALAGRPVVAFAGIGRPDKFFATLSEIGAEVVEERGFPDHHRFDEADARGILAIHRRSGAIPVTTEKDRARLGSPAGGALKALADAAVALPVSLALDEASAVALHAMLERLLSGRSRRLGAASDLA